MSLHFYTETGQKKNSAAILRVAALWLEDASNKRVKVELNIVFEEDKNAPQKSA
jgi:hypothetical protein